MKHIKDFLFRDERGLLTQEWIFLLTICVIGIVGGMSVMRDAVNLRFVSGANAIGAANPAYTISDYSGKGYTANGSTYSGGTTTVTAQK